MVGGRDCATTGGGDVGRLGPKGQARCGGFPLPEGVSRAAGPLDGDPMALAGLIARSHRSVPDSQCAVFTG